MTIPLIDLTAPDEAISAAIAAACVDHGFFGVVNHGVPAAHIDAALGAARDFFALPMPRKMQVARPRPGINRGYIAPGTEVLARLGGQDTPPDDKELITFGPDAFPEDDYYLCAAAAPHWVPNRWPEGMPGFRDAVLAYWADMQHLARRILRWCALALEADPGYFETRTDRDPSQLRLIHYPPQVGPPLAGQLRAGVHTDLNLLTIVHSDNNRCGGLEVRHRDGRWIAAPQFDGFMVNIGDSMMRWCNDRWKSTPHRVANPPQGQGAAADRIALAFFFIANYDALIECLPSCVDAAHPPAFAPITVGDYRAQRFARTAAAPS